MSDGQNDGKEWMLARPDCKIEQWDLMQPLPSLVAASRSFQVEL